MANGLEVVNEVILKSFSFVAFRQNWVNKEIFQNWLISSCLSLMETKMEESLCQRQNLHGHSCS